MKDNTGEEENIGHNNSNKINKGFTIASIAIIAISNLILLLLFIISKKANSIEDGLGLGFLFILYLAFLYTPLNILAIILGLKGNSIYKKMDKQYINIKRKRLQIISDILLAIMTLVIGVLMITYIPLTLKLVFM